MRSILVCEAGSEAHGEERSDLRVEMSKGKKGSSSGVLKNLVPICNSVTAKRSNGENPLFAAVMGEGRRDGNNWKMSGAVD